MSPVLPLAASVGLFTVWMLVRCQTCNALSGLYISERPYVQQVINKIPAEHEVIFKIWMKLRMLRR
ncbi:hypothetical protein B0H12DRAFT_1152034 [Mycena haematopus]|nr:hypothetical protein B0H12DRAFT_1152034 [Mycena haematopus]